MLLLSPRCFLVNFIPHGHCYLWKPGLVSLHIVSDLLITFAYYSIPILLLYFVRKRQDLPFNWMFVLFGAFIVACGTTHMIEIWTLWHPHYWLSGILKLVTAVISVSAAVQLVPLIPKALVLPSPAQLQAANKALETEIAERKLVEVALLQSEALLKEQATKLEQTLYKLQLTQAQLVHSEKMSSLGQMVAGIAHEINNPVNFIYGNITHATEYTKELVNVLSLYQEHYPNPVPEIQEVAEAIDLDFLIEDVPNLLASVKLGAERIRNLVLSLRNFSRLDEAEMKQVDIHEGIDNALLILQHRLKPTAGHTAIEVVKDYGKLPLVECYASQLNQVFMNILSNAIDAIEDFQQTQTAEAIAHRPPTIKICTEALENNHIVIRISDNGNGIAEKVQQRIFDPFFTTKSIGKGTGLGLSISYQIIEKHKGYIKCISAPGEGAEFLIEIPIWQTAPQCVLVHSELN
jgi:two-component system NtrC family sensor kinase